MKDPRIDRQKRHVLLDIIVIATCAIVCGARTWEDIEYFGQAHEGWFRTFLSLPNGIPSHDTFRRVFIIIDAKEFGHCFAKWVSFVSESLDGKVIGIDGKTLRGTLEKEGPALHIVNAWCHDNKTILAQYAVDDKSNEITALPKLLEILAVKGCIMTMDAMHTQRDTAEKILVKGGNYVMALKGNQKSLYDDVMLAFDGASYASLNERMGNGFITTDNDHGRLEERRYWLTEDVGWLQEIHE